jgi:hypothetical protein
MDLLSYNKPYSTKVVCSVAVVGDLSSKEDVQGTKLVIAGFMDDFENKLLVKYELDVSGITPANLGVFKLTVQKKYAGNSVSDRGFNYKFINEDQVLVIFGYQTISMLFKLLCEEVYSQVEKTNFEKIVFDSASLPLEWLVITNFNGTLLYFC